MMGLQHLADCHSEQAQRAIYRGFALIELHNPGL